MQVELPTPAIFNEWRAKAMPIGVGMFTPVFENVIFIAENMPRVVAVTIVIAMSVRKSMRLPVILFLPLLVVGWMLFVLWECRHIATQEGYDLSLPSLRSALEQYIETGTGPAGEGHPQTIIQSRKYAPTIGYWEAKRYLGSNFFGFVLHDVAQDSKYIPEGYNKGDDWFEATLGEPMFYSSGFYYNLFESYEETLDDAQLRKMEYIVNALGVKPGMQALDIGCGWGRFPEFLASRGANVTGVVAASDLLAYGQRMNKKHGSKVTLLYKNFYEDLGLPEKHFDVISAIEMAEHAGIVNYPKYLKKVYSLLKDDGVFYIQVAGLQRGYAKGHNSYEELVWGLFMEEHVFPGADSSTPLGWVITHLEQAGFEVQTVQNMGLSYGRTLHAWQLNWEAKKDEIVKVYGERTWRRWHVFSAWCVDIASSGGSTVNFITVVKQGSFKARYGVQYRMIPGRWKSPEPLGPLTPRHG